MKDNNNTRAKKHAYFSILSSLEIITTGKINASQCWNPTLEINTNTKVAKFTRTTIRTDRHMDRYVILTLREFYPVACGCIRYAQLKAARLDVQNETWKTIHRDL